MGTRKTGPGVKAVKLSKCSICYQVPTPDCDWRQGRCPHREPIISSLVIRNFLNFFRRTK